MRSTLNMTDDMFYNLISSMSSGVALCVKSTLQDHSDSLSSIADIVAEQVEQNNPTLTLSEALGGTPSEVSEEDDAEYEDDFDEEDFDAGVEEDSEEVKDVEYAEDDFDEEDEDEDTEEVEEDTEYEEDVEYEEADFDEEEGSEEDSEEVEDAEEDSEYEEDEEDWDGCGVEEGTEDDLEGADGWDETADDIADEEYITLVDNSTTDTTSVVSSPEEGKSSITEGADVSDQNLLGGITPKIARNSGAEPEKSIVPPVTPPLAEFFVDKHAERVKNNPVSDSDGVIYSVGMDMLVFLRLNKAIRTLDVLRGYFSEKEIKSAVDLGKISMHKGRIII